MNIFLLASLSIIVSVAAQFSFRVGMKIYDLENIEGMNSRLNALGSIGNRYVLAGFCLYALSALVWLKVLSQWQVSKAYPLVGLGFVVTAAVGYFIGEEVSLTRLVGVMFICIGVFIVGRS